MVSETTSILCLLVWGVWDTQTSVVIKIFKTVVSPEVFKKEKRKIVKWEINVLCAHAKTLYLIGEWEGGKDKSRRGETNMEVVLT